MVLETKLKKKKKFSSLWEKQESDNDAKPSKTRSGFDTFTTQHTLETSNGMYFSSYTKPTLALLKSNITKHRSG